MAKNTVPIIIGAVVFGFLAIGLTLFSVFNNAAPPVDQPTGVAAQPVAATSHYVALRPIYPRTVITSDMLRESQDGENTVGGITNLGDIVGKMANRTIQTGQSITPAALTVPVARVIPANIPIPIGLRAVAVWVDPSQTAAGLVDVGDRVDVVATHELTLEKTGNQVVVGATAFTAGRTIAQDVEVLAVDRSITEIRTAPAPATVGPDGQPATAPAPGQPGAAPAPTPAPPPPPPGQEQRTRVILAAAPEIAQRLVAANTKGELHITIRNPNSRERFPQPESREYPSRIAAGPPTPRASTPAATGNRNTGGGNNAGGERIYSPQPPVDLTIPNPTTLAPGTIIRDDFPRPPQPLPEKEVTVIRGTEKTRVIVPR